MILVAQAVKNLPSMQKNQVQRPGVQSLGWEDPLEEGMVTHSSILAWRIPWTEESGGVQFSLVAHPCLTIYNPMNHSSQASLSITNSRSPPKPMSIESVIPPSHLILCRALLLPPSIFPSIRIFSCLQILRYCHHPSEFVSLSVCLCPFLSWSLPKVSQLASFYNSISVVFLMALA